MTEQPKPNVVRLDGGIVEQDGAWTVECSFRNIPTEEEAQRISRWLEQLVNEHLNEIGWVDQPTLEALARRGALKPHQ